MGTAGFAAMVDLLEANGIKAVRHGDIADLGRFRLVTLTDLDNIGTPFGNRITEEELEAVGGAGAKPPLIAFVHWGVEWQTVPTSRQMALAERLSQEGVSLIVGAHSHRALPHFAALGGGQATVAYSLGNFLFDQFNRLASGSILEVRFFADGTFFVRLVEMPNFFHYAIGRR
jgi:poly-gamma-glutamate synthesis protein (capsule biosynthesis protein)